MPYKLSQPLVATQGQVADARERTKTLVRAANLLWYVKWFCFFFTVALGDSEPTGLLAWAAFVATLFLLQDGVARAARRASARQWRIYNASQRRRGGRQ
jgi:hypothetical protein